MFDIPQWLPLMLASALCLGFYDIAKKHALRENSVMPVLFFATLCGSATFILIMLISGNFAAGAQCSMRSFALVFVKSIIVAASWTCSYYAIRELPISIASPIRASSPVWTFIGGLFIFGEIPTYMQAVAMALIFAGYMAFVLIGRMEGFGLKGKRKGLTLIFAGTILGAGAALFDKYLLGLVKLPPDTVQLYFSIDLVIILGAAWLARIAFFGEKHSFSWRWTVPVTGVLVIAADYLYFHALAIPDTQISIMSLVRRTSVVVAFAFGAYIFKDRNIVKKVFALLFIIAGVLLLALNK